MRGPHIISKKHRASQTKSKTTWHYIFAKSTPRSNNINDLPPVSGSQVLKISLTASIVDKHTFVFTMTFDTPFAAGISPPSCTEVVAYTAVKM